MAAPTRLHKILYAVVSFFLLFNGHHVSSYNDGLDLPRELYECTQLLSKDLSQSYQNETSSNGASAIDIQTICLSQFVWKFGNVDWAKFNITEGDKRMITSLMHSVVTEHSRVKRRAGPAKYARIWPGTGFRIRREYRRLPDRERFAFNVALNIMKRNGQYDTFANLHRGVVVNSAHFGPNFFGWHRVYLAMVEEALRRIDRRLSLPYWDCTMDFDMENPVNSIIWSAPFLGNGDGAVTEGPFAQWETPVGPLTRNIAGRSRLISKEAVARILTRCRTREISDPTAEREFNLEFVHGGPHVWVGGQMSGLNTAAHDPVFFLHHAFIDYIWELFRIRQARRCGINPATDYPEGVELHESDRIMDGFPQYRNIDGYRAYWTIFWYRYESSPTCNRFRPFCGSPYLTCDIRRGRCVSVARRVRMPERPEAAVMAFGPPSPMQANRARAEEASINVGPTFMAPESDGRTQDAGFRGRRKRAAEQSTSKSVSTQAMFGKPFVAPTSDGRTSDSLGFNIAHGVPSSDPVGPEPQYRGQILFRSAIPAPLIPTPNYSNTTRESILQAAITESGIQQGMGKATYEETIFVPVDIVYERANMRDSTSDHCQLDYSGRMRVDVRAEGLNYVGVSDKYAEFDTTASYSSSVVYAAVKRYPNATSEVFVEAIDSCGRLCQPRCLDKSGPVTAFRNCNGIKFIRATDTTVDANIDGAVSKVWLEETSGRGEYRLRPSLQFLCGRSEQQAWSGGNI